MEEIEGRRPYFLKCLKSLMIEFSCGGIRVMTRVSLGWIPGGRRIAGADIAGLKFPGTKLSVCHYLF